MDRRNSIALPSRAAAIAPNTQIPAVHELSRDRLATQLMSEFNAAGIAIALESASDPRVMVCVARCGSTAPFLGALLDIDSGISGRAVREKRILHSEDTYADSSVDRDACERLGIRALVVVPLFRDSRCTGVLEVLWDHPRRFDPAILARLESRAARILELIADPVAETELQDPENWEEKAAAFRLDKEGRLSSLKAASSKGKSNSDAHSPKVFSLLDLHGPVARPHLRAIVLVSVAASLAFSAPRLLHRTSAPSSTSNTPVTTGSASSGRVSASDPESTAALVSDAAPSVRVLMAKAIGGNSVAQALLADHYANGDGVNQDRVKAAVWAVMASTNGKGNSVARILNAVQPYELGQVEFNLGSMFRDGTGVPRNLVNAYSWFSLSEATGDVRASAALLNLEQVMPADQIAEAKRKTPEVLHRLTK